jgi:hypothetical protein
VRQRPRPDSAYVDVTSAVVPTRPRLRERQHARLKCVNSSCHALADKLDPARRRRIVRRQDKQS